MAGNEQFGGPIGRRDEGLWTLPIAGLVAGLVGLAFGLPALRLSGLYLALATFAIAVAMPSTAKRFEEWTGGGTGIQLFGTPELTGSISNVHVLGRTFTPNDWIYYLAWSIALVAFAVAWLILRGRTGRAFRAVRDSETAAVSSGVSLARYKTLAFGISAAYAGVAGSLFVDLARVRQPRHVPCRALDLPPRRHRRRRARRPLRARLRRDLRRVPAALGTGSGSRLAAARPDRRGDAEAGRARDRLRRRPDPAHVRVAERGRRALPARRPAALAASLLSAEVDATQVDTRRATALPVQRRPLQRSTIAGSVGGLRLERTSRARAERAPPDRSRCWHLLQSGTSRRMIPECAASDSSHAGSHSRPSPV